MAELQARRACQGLLPVHAGQTVLREVEPGPVFSVAPFRGQDAALSEALMATHGVAFPEPGQCCAAGDVICLWTGRRQAFLLGAAPDAALADLAAITDQSDAWASMALRGPDAEAVLARLVPLDLRHAAFPVGRAARTLAQHMTVTLWRVEATELRLMVFRSMARSLAHELGQAMASVDARRRAG